jgi:hypothetical protein
VNAQSLANVGRCYGVTQEADNALALVKGSACERGDPVSIPRGAEGDDVFGDVNFAGHKSIMPEAGRS